MLSSKQKIKSILRIYSGDRAIDLEIAKALGWSYITNEKSEMGDWVGISPQDQTEVIPFFSEELNEIRVFMDHLEEKYKIKFAFSYNPDTGEYWCSAEYTNRAGITRPIETVRNGKEIVTFFQASIAAYRFIKSVS